MGHKLSETVELILSTISLEHKTENAHLAHFGRQEKIPVLSVFWTLQVTDEMLKSHEHIVEEARKMFKMSCNIF